MEKTILTFLLAFFCQFAAAHEAAPLDGAIAELQHEWAKAHYQTPERQQEPAFKALADKARQVSARYSGRAEPLVWEAIVLAGYAKAKGGLGALDAVKSARELLQRAEKIDPAALDGSVYTSLGSLYAKVPGWPLSFGDKQKAREYLDKALQLNPGGIDPNYFYGDLLLEQGEYARAAEYLRKAQSAAPRPGRADADTGRRREIQEALDKARSYL